MCDSIQIKGNIINPKKAKEKPWNRVATLFQGYIFGARDGTWRLLRLRLACWWLADRRLATVPGSPLLAKNSPQDCFLTLRPSRVQALRKIKKSRYCDSSLFGARDGTWTRTGLPHAPQTCASADSATLADVRSTNKWYYSRTLHQCQYLNAKNTHLF